MAQDVAGARVWFLAFALACLVGVRLAACALFPVYDDAFITFRYAANLADGFGFVYHPGEQVLGTTAPAFGLFLALLMALGLGPETIVPFLNIATDLALALLTARILAERSDHWTALVFVFAYAAMPTIGRITVGGMEANAFMLACVSAAYLHTRDRRRTAIVIASLAFFFRPEAVLMVAVLCIFEVFEKGFWRGVALGLIALATVLPFLFVESWVYGSFLPQSVQAKSQSHSPLSLVARVLIVPDPIAGALLLFVPFGIAVAVRARQAVLAILAAFVALYVLAYVVRAPSVWSWYAFPIQYGIALFGSLALAHLAKRFVAPTGRVFSASIGGLALLLAVEWSLFAWWLWPDGVTKHIYRPLAQWCSERTNPRTTFLADDIGILGFHCRGRIYDAAGLVWPEMLLLKTERAVIETYKPDYLFLNANEVAAGMLRGFNDSYRPIARFSKTGQTDLAVSAGSVGRGWTQDYLLFERVRSTAP